ncbi:Proteins of 100 residues with WXG [Clostridiales bacterium CHKCI006]|uniref:ESAT-6-like protein n=1 Tax=Candidatus Fimiplasma intestinipullorum TaxID=2840825 RepID=A0A9D1HQJ9_9FIRM|nr:Proteins of 100 residues with WXG [Clostridiales bacterium CHKCI006]HIU13664.1 WXG100 family type VII secretion target [Candidatus Fimiplasma intestinipullorum]
MAGQIRVTPEFLDLASSRMDAKIEEYQHLYTRLYEEIDRLSGSWQGKDHQAFVDQIRGFEGDFVKMAQLMREYSLYLKQSANAYRETQEQVCLASRRLQN